VEGYSKDLKQTEKDFTTKLQQHEKQEEIYWKQKSRNKWLKEGDKNTKFFHQTTIHRRHFNKTASLRKDNGDRADNHEEMEGVLLEYFATLLSDPELARESDINEVVAHLPKVISPTQNELLMKPVDLGELEEALNQMKQGTTPGPDRFTINVFVQFWDLVKMDVHQIVEASREGGGILKAFNATFFTLIPKTEGADDPSLFRPISLYNMIYKLITKILDNHLKPILPLLISADKSIFVEA